MNEDEGPAVEQGAVSAPTDTVQPESVDIDEVEPGDPTIVVEARHGAVCREL